MTEPRLTVDNLTGDRLDELVTAELELARLREGEEPTTSPYTNLSPGQWVWEWNHATPAKRLEVAADAMRDRSTASTCFFMAHEKRLKESGHAWVALARIRDVLADMEKITGARHWARILRSAVDGEPAPVSSGPAATEATEPVQQIATDPDDPPVQCWHIEPDTPCDWDVCRQPERLAAGDYGTDPRE